MNSIEEKFSLDFTNYLLDHPLSILFRYPVDPVNDQVPDYFETVHNPMDLTTVRDKISRKSYSDSFEWKADIMLIWNNAIEYHSKKKATKYIVDYAKYFQRKCMKKLAFLPKKEEDLWFLKLQKVNSKINKILAAKAFSDSIIPRLHEFAITPPTK
ncbi:Bromodomain containing protein [Trichomonas vaginalis G3]|uniref:Bromodomain containing protein n=1 Tax=Trichomonas vaginalis (strain ATCC PRA-98 / G3) TaxID=412133 RepID=A2DW57_TRIV3|nr:histone acetyltransferase protein [Trichomonas vaginalis G3]EAY15358.1 Bromodomain containing protein [Trichomonas vaginalis G3]KAI5496776.1 histone acetyltransferase protein [Trichomonas vaginalis G3]|eukprot:XP_001327581.1 Bromodomain containing protein [Trichomonas vaginalis G3]